MKCKIIYNYLDTTANIITKDGSYSVPDYFGKRIEEVITDKKGSDSNIIYDNQESVLRIVCPTEECSHHFGFKVIKTEEKKNISFVCTYCNVRLFNTNSYFSIAPILLNEDKTSEIDIGGTIISFMQEFLKNLGDENDICTITRDKEFIEFRAEEPDGKNQYLVLRIFFLYSSRQVQIPNIVVTDKLKHTGTGLKIIKIIYDICKYYNYKLFIVDMCGHFYERMLNRGAFKSDLDTVQITDKTDLSYHY